MKNVNLMKDFPLDYYVFTGYLPLDTNFDYTDKMLEASSSMVCEQRVLVVYQEVS